MVSWISIANLALVIVGIYYAISQGAAGTDTPQILKTYEQELAERRRLNDRLSELKRNFRQSGQREHETTDLRQEYQSKIDKYKNQISANEGTMKELIRKGQEKKFQFYKLQQQTKDLETDHKELEKQLKELSEMAKQLPEPPQKREWETAFGRVSLSGSRKFTAPIHVSEKTEHKAPALSKSKKPLAAKSGGQDNCDLTRLLNNLPSDMLVTQYENGEKDICISPLTTFSAILMILAGQKEEFQVKVLESMSIRDCSFEEILKKFKELLDSLEEQEEGVKVDIANVEFIEQNLSELKENYEKIMQTYLGVTFQRVDMNDPQEAMEKINSLIAEITKNVMMKFIEEASTLNGAYFVAMSAMYFQGEWEYAFDEIPGIGSFFSTPTSETPIKFMKNVAKYQFAYLADPACSALKMNFKGKDLRSKFEIYIFLPNYDFGGTFEKFLKDFQRVRNEKPEKIYNLREREVHVELPKFEHTSHALNILPLLGNIYGKSFKENLQHLHNIFKNEIIFSDKILEKVRMEFSPAGLKVATATAALCVRGDEPAKFIANHPFLYSVEKVNMVTEERHTILVGVVTNPKPSE